MKSALLPALCLSCLLAAAGQPLQAQTPSTQGEQILGQVITELERQVIDRYVYDHGGSGGGSGGGGVVAGTQQGAGKGKGKGKGKNKGQGKQTPPGLANRPLPPGLARQQTLPPGLAKRDLPGDLQSLLPPRAGTRIYNIDDNAVLIEIGTGLVLDIMEGVLAGH